ncbi:protein-S-isoprenylcysteine methyltransferase [Pseudoalteromonas phenolica]|uniref:Protein-S-isoprenylcysteine methyltransferase n=1 Tax=Pseudoalteromonas phenolica TaxID=161398 RepID=A0A5R9Q1I4_9GAMM|nr:isoprenylcysteine carboxylmethyltransferase family protein [Pseudoalteromonas phenolica]TLX47008.1 protein-S-isoprenylcysteine methyltransferase [Pseudoalteromonas phenolica]
MHVLDNKVPPPVVAVFCASAMYWLAHSKFAIPINILAHMKLEIALTILLVAVLIAFCAVWSFKQAQTTISPTKPQNSAALVTTGLFKHSRNPMYVAVALSLFAFAVYLADALSLAGVGAFVLFITQFQIKPEERILKEKFGAPYDVYLTKVRRWI